MNTITFYSENEDQNEVNFNEETLTFTLQLVKFYFMPKNWAFKYLRRIVIALKEGTSGTTKIVGDIASKGNKVKIGHCSICNRKKTLSDITIQAKGLSSFFLILGRSSAIAGKKLESYVIKNLGKTLEITSNLTTAATTRILKNKLSTLSEVINFYDRGKGIYLGKYL